MSSWINAAASTLVDIIKNIKNKFRGYIFKVAFIAYRDLCDGANNIKAMDFTSEIDKVISFIQSQTATGGGDEAEDVLGALEKGLTLNYSDNSLLC
jgi:hypothetical protein